VKLSPRYDAEPIIELDGAPAAIGVPMLRQRRRFAAELSALPDAAWSTPSRCEGWTVQDVVAHLATVDQFWNLSVMAGLAGTPTRILQDFDPKATPATMVDAARGAAPAETLGAFLDASGAFCSAIEALDDAGWSTIAEAPPGHVTISALAYHALWDAWVHERDVLAPLGMAQTIEPDEIVASLRYAAALSPAFALLAQPDRTGALAIVADDPDARIAITVDTVTRVADADAPAGAFVLSGNAVELLEALSVRAPLPVDPPPEQAWLLVGLSIAFGSNAGVG
jgi:uncharacterized protein (TIGR03083 family)